MPAMWRLNKSVYESLPLLYGIAGVALLWASYRYQDAGWSTPCAMAGLLGLIAGLMIWMHRRDFRATGAAYRERGRPVGGSLDDPR